MQSPLEWALLHGLVLASRGDFQADFTERRHVGLAQVSDQYEIAVRKNPTQREPLVRASLYMDFRDYQAARLSLKPTNRLISSPEEVTRLIEAAPNLLYRTLLMLLYATGLRRTEAATLKVSEDF